MSDMPRGTATLSPFSGWRHSLAQNMSFLLSFVILAGLTLLYIGLFLTLWATVLYVRDARPSTSA